MFPVLLRFFCQRHGSAKKGARSYAGHISFAVNIVFEMKSLLVLLLLGAVVTTFAEKPFEDEAVQEFLDEEGDKTIAKLADEQNDAHCCLRSVQVANLMLR